MTVGSLRKQKLFLIGSNRLVGDILGIVQPGIPALLNGRLHGAHKQLLLLTQLLFVDTAGARGFGHV
jgi:hypothetical protein